MVQVGFWGMIWVACACCLFRDLASGAWVIAPSGSYARACFSAPIACEYALFSKESVPILKSLTVESIVLEIQGR